MESDNNNENQKLLNHKRQLKNSLEILPLKINKKEEKSEAKIKNIYSYIVKMIMKLLIWLIEVHDKLKFKK